MRRRGVLALGLGALVLSTGATAAPWTIDREASSLEMSVRAFGGTSSGRFSEWDGDIVFDPAAPADTRADVRVRAASLRLSPAAATARATGPAFLDAGRYPDIRFQLHGLEPLGGDRYTARAAVTMKGRTRPVVFPVDLRVTGDRAHLTGAFTVERADYGIGTSGPWNRLVGRRVTVRVALQARRA